MVPTSVDGRIRGWLLALSAIIFPVTVIELYLTEHFEDTQQYIPFVVSGLGFAAVVLFALLRNKPMMWVLRLVMVAVIGASLLGMYYHLSGNFAFELDIRPNATRDEVVMDALRGANPLLAPGILAIAGLISLIATYEFPFSEPST